MQYYSNYHLTLKFYVQGLAIRSISFQWWTIYGLIYKVKSVNNFLISSYFISIASWRTVSLGIIETMSQNLYISYEPMKIMSYTSLCVASMHVQQWSALEATNCFKILSQISGEANSNVTGSLLLTGHYYWLCLIRWHKCISTGGTIIYKVPGKISFQHLVKRLEYNYTCYGNLWYLCENINSDCDL